MITAGNTRKAKEAFEQHVVRKGQEYASGSSVLAGMRTEMQIEFANIRSAMHNAAQANPTPTT